jgi:hypothetical protein
MHAMHVCLQKLIKSFQKHHYIVIDSAFCTVKSIRELTAFNDSVTIISINNSTQSNFSSTINSLLRTYL